LWRREFCCIFHGSAYGSSEGFLLPIGRFSVSGDGNALIADITKERIQRFPGFDKSS